MLLILSLLIIVGVFIWQFFKSKNDDSDLCPTTLPGYKRMYAGDSCYAKSHDDCDTGYTFVSERCCKKEDAFGTPTIDPDTRECTRIPKPCNPKDPIDYSIYRYDPSGKCVFSKCMPTYKYDKKSNTCIPTATDPLFLDCMANMKDFEKVSGSPRPSDPNKAREWDRGHGGYCDTLTARSPSDTITGKFYNGTCYISINQVCKKHPEMSNIGRFDDSTKGGPSTSSDALCAARVSSWKKDC